MLLTGREAGRQLMLVYLNAFPDLHFLVLPPRVDRVPSVGRDCEPGVVQALIAEATVEALDVRVLHRLPWVDEMQPDAARPGPGVQALPMNSGPLSLTSTGMTCSR